MLLNYYSKRVGLRKGIFMYYKQRVMPIKIVNHYQLNLVTPYYNMEWKFVPQGM